jgi:hypothetical protein
MSRSCGNCCGDCCPCYEIIEEFELEECGIKVFDYGNKCNQFSEFKLLQPRRNYKCIPDNNDAPANKQILNDDDTIIIDEIELNAKGLLNNSNYNNECKDSGCETFSRGWGVFEHDKLCGPPIISGLISCTGSLIGLEKFIYSKICSDSDSDPKKFYLVAFCFSHLNSSGGIKSVRPEHTCDYCSEKCPEDDACRNFPCTAFKDLTWSCNGFDAVIQGSSYKIDECESCLPNYKENLNWCITSIETVTDENNNKSYLCSIDKCGPVGIDGFPIGLSVGPNQKSYCINSTNHGPISVNLYRDYNLNGQTNTSRIVYNAILVNSLTVDDYSSHMVDESSLVKFDTWFLKHIDNEIIDNESFPIYDWDRRPMSPDEDSIEIKLGLFDTYNEPYVSLVIIFNSKYYKETHTYNTYPICPQYNGKIGCFIFQGGFIFNNISIDVEIKNNENLRLKKSKPRDVLKYSKVINSELTTLYINEQPQRIGIADLTGDENTLKTLHYYCGDEKIKCEDFGNCMPDLPFFEERKDCKDTDEPYLFRSRHYPKGKFIIEYTDYLSLDQRGARLLGAVSCNCPYEIVDYHIEDPEISGSLSITIKSEEIDISITPELRIRNIELKKYPYSKAECGYDYLEHASFPYPPKTITQEFRHNGGYVDINISSVCWEETFFTFETLYSQCADMNNIGALFPEEFYETLRIGKYNTAAKLDWEGDNVEISSSSSGFGILNGCLFYLSSLGGNPSSWLCGGDFYILNNGRDVIISTPFKCIPFQYSCRPTGEQSFITYQSDYILHRYLIGGPFQTPNKKILSPEYKITFIPDPVPQTPPIEQIECDFSEAP